MSFAVSLSLLGLVAIAAPMVASVLVALFPRPYAKWFSVLGAAVSTVCTIALAANFAGAGMPDTQVPLISFGQTLVMGFTFDRMSTLLAPAFVGIGLLVVIYSIPYMSENNREHPDAPRRRFYAYLATFIGAMAGLVYSSTLLGQLVFFEITGACSWGLISYYMTPTAKKAGMKALIITHIGALGLYLGAAIVFAHTGTFAITTHCTDVHALLQWVDQFYTEEVHILASAGEENTDYIVDPDGTWRMTAAAQNNTYFTSETLITSGTAVPGLSSDAFQRRYSDSTVCYISEQLDVVNASAQRPFPYYSLTKAQQEKIAPLQAAIGRLVDESIARWVLGEVEITDASFAQFGQDLNDAGLPAFMAFWQKILDGGNSK